MTSTYAAIETLLRAAGWQKYAEPGLRCWRHPDLRTADAMSDSWMTALRATIEHERKSADLLETVR